MSCNKFMLRIDMFSSPVTVTFNKQQKYSTKCGVIATLLILITLIVYFYILLTHPLVESKNQAILVSDDVQESSNEVSQESSNDVSQEANIGVGQEINQNLTSENTTFVGYHEVRKTTVNLDPLDYSKRYDLMQNGVVLAARLTGPGFDLQRVFIEFWSGERTSDGTNYTRVPITPCQLSMFPSELHEELKALNYNEFYCPAANDLEISGNFISENAKDLSIYAVI